MTTIHVAPEICNPNKFQPETRRQFTPDQLGDLASIGEIGFIHTPIGFKENGTYMIIVGWRRRCAWMLYHPGEPMPLELRDKPSTDQALYRLTVTENEGRENFNAIQRADLAAQAIALGMTQADAGKLFNPPLGQAAISHLLSLRKLPAEIRALVEARTLPERLARQLVTPAKFARDLTIKAADMIAKAREEEKDRVAGNALDDLYRSAGKSLEFGTPWVDAYWSNGRTVLKGLDWPKTPIPVPDARADKGEPSEIPACVDCPFNIIHDRRTYCMRPACHAVKIRVWNDLQKAKEADKADQPSAGKSVRTPASDYQRKDNERRKQLNRDNKASRALIAAATPAIATSLPDSPILLDLLFNVVKFRTSMNMRDADKKWKAAPSKEKREMIAKVLITEHVGIDPWKRTTPAHAQDSIEKLARSLKVKLPKDWQKEK